MPKITKFDRFTIRHSGLPEKAAAALAAVAAEHGLTVTYAGGTIDDLSFTMKLRFAVDDPAAATAKRQQTFAECCHLFGLTPEHLGATVMHRGTAYRITGLELGRSKFPVRVERIKDGKGFVFPEAIAQTAKLSPARATAA